MRTIYKNRTITVGEAKAKINGKYSKFLKIVENDIIVVLPVIGEEIIMERQYRPVIGKYIYELPAGHIEKGESKVGAVKREMHEETGYVPKRVSLLFKGYPQPGTNTAMQYFYIAKDFSKEDAQPEANEDIKVRKVRLEKAIEMISKGEIVDVKTIACLLYYYYIFKNGS